MKTKCSETRDGRHQNLIKEFLLVIKECGDSARYMKKIDLYRMAAQRANYETIYASRIIRRYTKGDNAILRAAEKEVSR